jgi:A/G-specific adenine glycosylase
MLRGNADAVPPAALLTAWPDPIQGARALGTLLADGLAVRQPDGALRLP